MLHVANQLGRFAALGGSAHPYGPPGAAFSVVAYGADATGTSDCRTAFGSAAAAANAAGGHVYFPAGTYKISGTWTSVAGTYYYAPTGVTIACSGGVYVLSNTTFDGFTFRCDLLSTASGVCLVAGTTGGTTVISKATIKKCTFIGADSTHEFKWSRILLRRAHDFVISNNTFTGTLGSGGNIQVVGGKRNRIIGNTISGGTTGILHMYETAASGGGFDSVIEHEVVTGNTIGNVSEENISFDVMANSATEAGVFEYDTIAAVSGQDITLSTLTWPSYVGYDIIFYDGDLRGKTRTISGQSGTGNKVFTVTGDIADAAAGDKVVIGAPMKHNYIANNTVTCYDYISTLGDTYPAVLLYGLCFGNVIEKNTVPLGKIDVRSVDGVTKHTGQVTDTYGRATCGYNTIRENTILDGGSNEGINLFRFAYTADGTTGYSVSTGEYKGSNVTDNATARVLAAYQEAYFSGNSGTESFTSTTEADSEFTYDDGGV